MVLQGTAHKISEDIWTVEQNDGSILPVSVEDINEFYKDLKTCGKDLCNCWILKEGLRLEYQIVERDGIQYANII